MDDVEKTKLTISMIALFVSIAGLGTSILLALLVQKIIERRERKREVKELILGLTVVPPDYAGATLTAVIADVMSVEHQKDFDRWAAQEDTVPEVLEKASQAANEANDESILARNKLSETKRKLVGLWRTAFMIFDLEGEPLQDAIDVLFKTSDEVLHRREWKYESFVKEIDDIERNVFPVVLNKIEAEIEKLWNKTMGRKYSPRDKRKLPVFVTFTSPPNSSAP